jgi:DNA polymerase sigma
MSVSVFSRNAFEFAIIHLFDHEIIISVDIGVNDAIEMKKTKLYASTVDVIPQY